jgi:outer membrane protein assembly factor BamB
MKRNVLTILCFLTFCAITVLSPKDAEAGFSKKIAGARGELVIQTRDGGYLLIGRIVDPNSSFMDAFVVKMNSLGKQVWKKRFRGPKILDIGPTLMLDRAIETTDGYVVAGPVISENGQIALFKLNSLGNLVWSRFIKPLRFEFDNFGGSLAPTADGGFIFSGSYAISTSNNPLLAMKFNASGDILWKKAYLFAANATSIFQTPDGGYLLAGGPDGSEQNSTNFVLLRLSSTGALRWKKSFSVPPFNTFGRCILLSDGGFAVAAFNTTRHILVIRLNSAGTVLWSKFYGDSEGNSDRTSIAQTTDGGLVVGADGENGALVFKLDPSGNILWTSEFGASREDFQTASITSTSDGGSAAAGLLFSAGGHEAAFMIRFDPAGRAGCGSYRSPSITMVPAQIQVKSQPVSAKTPEVTAAADSIAVSTTLPSLTSLCP